MGTDCYLAKKKKDLADIDFVQLDRLYYFEEKFPYGVLYPVDEFKQRIEILRNAECNDKSAYWPKTKEDQIYWLDFVAANLSDADFAGIVDEYKYSLFNNFEAEINVVSDWIRPKRIE